LKKRFFSTFIVGIHHTGAEAKTQFGGKKCRYLIALSERIRRCGHDFPLKILSFWAVVSTNCVNLRVRVSLRITKRTMTQCQLKFGLILRFRLVN